MKNVNEKGFSTDIVSAATHTANGAEYATIVFRLAPLTYENKQGNKTKHAFLLDRTVVPGAAREFVTETCGPVVLTALDLKCVGTAVPKETAAQTIARLQAELSAAKGNTVPAVDDDDDEIVTEGPTTPGFRKFPVQYKVNGDPKTVDLIVTNNERDKIVAAGKHTKRGRPSAEVKAELLAAQVKIVTEMLHTLTGLGTPAAWIKVATRILPEIVAA